MKEDFEDYVRQVGPSIEAALQEAVAAAPGCPEILRKGMAYALLGPGKRLRPLLVLLAAEACGGSVQEAMPAACAVEMVHAYSLVHDDLPAMDNDDLRRGRPTCHKVFGEAMAILVGDALLTLAFETVAKGIAPPERAARCCAVLAEAAGRTGLVGGQVDDLVAQQHPSLPPEVFHGQNSFVGVATDDGPNAGEVGPTTEITPVQGANVLPFRGEPKPCWETLQYLESIHRRKTGAMIQACLRLGAIAVGSPLEKEAMLAEYGRALGLAFQIVDDLLDVRGDEATVGKRLRKDSAQGKLTFPGLLGQEESLRRAEQLAAEAVEAIAPLGGRASPLHALARYVLQRSR